jgi:hypothetical protein
VNYRNPTSKRLDDALLTTAMIDEMARADHWRGLDECLTVKPEAVEMFSRYAEAALRAIRRVEENKDLPFIIH